MNINKYFYNTIIITILSLIISYLIDGFSAIYLTLILAIFEIALSFDNAVINAEILKNMSKIWQKRFLTYGMIIAVFGLRFIFPIIIMSFVTNLGILEIIKLAIYQPNLFQSILKKSQKLIFAFGGAFLIMVFNNFLFEKKEINWLKSLEKYSEKLGKITNFSLIISILIGILIVYDTKDYTISIAFYFGILTYSLIHGINNYILTTGIENGLKGLIFLEILDASFSFDGVIGSFSLTSNIFLIFIGLGIGATFTRTLTLWMIKTKIINKYKYLEHGAQYSIGILGILMLLKIFVEISEIFTASVGISCLFLAFINSKYENIKISKLI